MIKIQNFLCKVREIFIFCHVTYKLEKKCYTLCDKMLFSILAAFTLLFIRYLINTQVLNV